MCQTTGTTVFGNLLRYREMSNLKDIKDIPNI